MKRSTLAALGLPLATLLSGCYRYVPVEAGAIPADAEVRVFVSRRGLADVPEEIPTSATYVNGRFVRQTADSLLLQVPVSRRVDGPGALDLRQNVFVPTVEVIEVQRRELSRSRTVLALVGGAGLATALLTVVIDAGGNPEADPGEGPDQIRIPFLSVGVP